MGSCGWLPLSVMRNRALMIPVENRGCRKMLASYGKHVCQVCYSSWCICCHKFTMGVVGSMCKGHSVASRNSVPNVLSTTGCAHFVCHWKRRSKKVSGGSVFLVIHGSEQVWWVCAQVRGIYVFRIKVLVIRLCDLGCMDNSNGHVAWRILYCMYIGLCKKKKRGWLHLYKYIYIYIHI